MLVALRKSAIETAMAIAGSVTIAAGTVTLLDLGGLRITVILSVICPLILAPPICFWNHRRASRMEELYARLALANRELTRMMHRLEDAARRDGMTGLLNRTAFFSALAPLCAESGGALVMIDADRFKAINDTHGHAAGDAALMAIAHVLEGLAPEGALTARIGGEEFAVFLPAAGEGEAAECAEWLRGAIATAGRSGPLAMVGLTVSLGVASAQAGVGVDRLYRAADDALYRSKQAGRDRTSRFGEKLAA